MQAEDHAAKLWDIHQIQQIYLTYAVSMDSHQWDLMDRLFLKDAEIRLSALARKVAGGAEVVDLAGWQRICRETDQTFDAIQHYLYPALVKVDGDIAHTRVYYVAQHAKNALAPNPFFVLGGWYDGELVKRGGEWRISKHALVDGWLDGNPEVILGFSLTMGALERTAEHRCPAWLTR